MKKTKTEGIIKNRKMVSKLTDEICESAGWNENARQYIEVAVSTVLHESDRTLGVVFDSIKDDDGSKCWSHAKMYEIISLALRTAYYDETGVDESPTREWLNKNVCGTTVERMIVATSTSFVFSQNIIELVVEFHKNIGTKILIV